MCRLFGLTAGESRVKATFWLLDAPDSLQAQSHRNVDGAGIGFFGPAGEPVLDKQPEPAFSDPEFIHAARQAESSSFVAHVRWATAGGRTVQNTHPFVMDGRVMAHNGGFGELGQLDTELGSYARLVLGDTDSERYFALNTNVAMPGELWALRYPGQHALHILARPAGPGPGEPGLHVRSATSSVHVPELDRTASVVIASEQLDGESGWRMLAPGELVHVRPDLSVHAQIAIPQPPAHLVPLPAGNPNIDT